MNNNMYRPLIRSLRCLSLLFIAASVLLAQAPKKATAPKTEPRGDRNVPYAEPANERQMLDVYAPAGGTNHPIVVWIHGGAWQKGSKDGVELKPQAFVDQGCVFVAINYRFVPAATVGEIAGDVAKAIGWAHRHGPKYGGDPGAIFVMGHSAGAQLAALVCTDERYLQREGVALTMIRGCVPVDGNTFDVTTAVRMSEGRQTRPFFDSHRRLFGHEAAQKELSAVNHVTPDKGIPPFLILHCADYVPITRTGLQAHLLYVALTLEGKVPTRVLAVPGKKHQTIDTELGQPGDWATQAVFAFVRAQMEDRPAARGAPGKP